MQNDLTSTQKVLGKPRDSSSVFCAHIRLFYQQYAMVEIPSNHIDCSGKCEKENPSKTLYNKNQFYDWHQDSFPNPYSHDHKNLNLRGKTRKLSMTLQLSDSKEYTGGELEFSLLTPKNKQYIETVKNTKKGTLIVFPSFVWHRVRPVKKGTRYSLVNWSCGLPWV